MRKVFLIRLLIFLAALATLLSVEYANAQGSRELEELRKDIDALRMRLTDLEQRNGSLEKENLGARAALEEAEDKLIQAESSLKAALETAEEAKRQYTQTETTLNLGKQALDLSKENLYVPWLLFAIAGGVVVLAGFILRNVTIEKVARAESQFASMVNSLEKVLSSKVDGTEKVLTSRVDSAEKAFTLRVDNAEKELTRRVENADKELTSKIGAAEKVFSSKIEQNAEKIEKEAKELNELKMEVAWAIGLFSVNHAVDVYLTKIEEAMDFGEKGLKQLEYGKPSQKEEKKAELTIATAKANLAYYYAFAGKSGKRITDEKRVVALDYVDSGLPVFRRFDYIEGVDCFLFVYKEFGKDTDSQKKWLEVYEIYRERLKIDPGIQTEYESYYRSVKNAAT